MREALERSPSVVLTGPRQVGKTTLAISISKTIPSVYLDLEDRLDLAKVRDIAAFHSENKDKLIILDEVQRLPEIFAQLRGLIDKQRRKGNKTGLFLFLGSASLELLQQSSESLAGRISYIELYPINILEFKKEKQDNMNRLWLRGGFPESLLADTDHNSLAWRRDFIKTYLERDIPQLGPRIPAETLERFWIMLAHNQGTTINASQLSRNLEVSGTTIARYLDLLVDLLLVRRLRPWRSNVGKRLVKSPKVYVRDSGITHSLLNILSYNDLLGHPVVGGSWEGFVIENIMSVTPPEAKPYFYRTSGGAEVDLILEFGVKQRWAIEIKHSSVPSISKGFYIACDDIKATRKYILYSGSDTFSMGNGVTAISLHDLMHKIMNH
ncbi:MAG: ATP-binding protein [Candidatus Dadabacteria bacterium]|nr:ATP-binding protein [Candidatus Dadabacteria bacterium]